MLSTSVLLICAIPFPHPFRRGKPPPRLQPATAAFCRWMNRLLNNSVALTFSPCVSLIPFDLGIELTANPLSKCGVTHGTGRSPSWFWRCEWSLSQSKESSSNQQVEVGNLEHVLGNVLKPEGRAFHNICLFNMEHFQLSQTLHIYPYIPTPWDLPLVLFQRLILTQNQT